MIHLNIGSNLKSKFGNKFKNISLAIDLLRNIKLKILNISNFYETPSYPNKNLPKFINIGLTVESKLGYLDLIEKTSLIEKKIGRVNSKKNDPRVCDIDIIDFNGIIRENGNVLLPHPRSHVRNFVLYPIKEIDPNWTHPVLKKNVEYLINHLSQNSRIEITRLAKSVII